MCRLIKSLWINLSVKRSVNLSVKIRLSLILMPRLSVLKFIQFRQVRERSISVFEIKAIIPLRKDLCSQIDYRVTRVYQCDKM